MNTAERRCPLLTADREKLRENLAALKERLGEALIEIVGVVKGVNAWPEVVRVFDEAGFPYLATSRADQLRAMAAMGLQTPRMLIRVPMLSELPDVVRYSDASLQSDRTVIRALAAEAARQGKTHAVTLMIDLGDLREGFWDAEELVDTALEIEREHRALRLAGVGVNLSCYGSVQPDKRNMQGLVSLADQVERAIGRPIGTVSGGASTSVRMALDGTMPFRVNQLRLGEILLLGKTDDCAPDFLHTDVFTFRAEVVECREKPSFPVGTRTVDAFHRVRHYEDRGIRRRALVAAGRVDYGDCADITPRLPGVEVLGASSDHTILDVQDAELPVRVGDILEFDVNYASLVNLSASRGVSRGWEGV